MRPPSRLAQSLDEVVGLAASRHEWRARLADEWQATERFLKPRGNIVPTIPCPSPGGEGCPRHVVRLGPDQFRAVCANTPRECDTLDLAFADVEVLALDTRRLATEIASALEIDLDYRERRGVIQIGRHLIAAGAGFPVALVLGSAAWRPALHLHNFGDAPGVILLSSLSSLDPDVGNQLRLRGNRIHVLDEVVGDDYGRLVPLAPPGILFHDLRDRYAATEPVRPPWRLPAGSTWEKLKFDLISSEEINVSTAGQSQKLRPEHLGLRNEKTGGVTEGWVFLRTVIAMRGSLGFSNIEPRYVKQLQLLNRALREGMGMAETPIMKVGRGEYETRFVSICSLSPAELAEISGRPNSPGTKKFGQGSRQHRGPTKGG
ncbi:MAG: hypothetical protein KIT43_02885 [Bauldia sp.]|nr:hypothetical protein [Bauldia sp.]